MTPKQLESYLQFAIANKFPVLIKGKPGIGKSDIVTQAAAAAGARLIITHPVVSDPTDYKGLPFASNGEAHFLPFNELNELINATEDTIYFIDDLGQAPPSVQAAIMQLLLARRINGFKVSDTVTFVAATNRKEDKAAVSGMLEPVKSRFASIIELEVTTDDWVIWAFANNMPTELISFIRFRPELLDKFEPSRDIINSPSPRTVANIGKQQNAGLPQEIEFEVFKGAVGEAFSIEYTSFLKLYRELPNIDTIILDPKNAKIPTQINTMYALIGLLASKMNATNIAPITQYLDRLAPEMSVSCMKDAITRKPDLSQTRDFIKWAADKSDLML